MLTVGLNSYITADESDVIARLIIDDAEMLNRWLLLDMAAKERKLVNACYRIESLRYGSYKHSLHQYLQFPRGRTDVIPIPVRHAQVWEAAATLNTQALKRLDLQRQGVKSVTVGNASESYADGSYHKYDTLISADAYALLRPYLLGSAVTF